MFKSLILIILFFKFCTSLDTLTTNQSIKDGQSLISKHNYFALGFFSPGNSSYKYLGIWHVKMVPQTVVWVANRNHPIIDSSGVLSINQYGDLVLHDSNNRLLWSTNVSVQDQVTTSPVAQLLDSGNLVLVQDNNENVWQSFDYPTDTQLPNMKLGLNLKTGIHMFLTSWKSKDDPGTGNYSYKINRNGFPQMFLYNGSTPYWRHTFSPGNNVFTVTSLPGRKVFFVYNQDEISAYYSDDDPSIMTRVVLDNSGLLQNLMWNDGVHQWKEQWPKPGNQCNKYGRCGSYGKCNPDNECMCLPGYEPKSPRDWYLRDGSKGCVRKNSGLSMCKNGEGFVKLGRLKLPDASIDAALIGTIMSSSECEQACLTNCSCTAFTSMNIYGMGTNCFAWYGELMDILEYADEGGSDLNVRVDAIELAKYIRKSKGSLSKQRKLAIALVSIVVPMFLVSLLAYIWLAKKKKTKVKRKVHNQSLNFASTKVSFKGHELEDSSTHPDLPIFDLSCIVAATENFSPTNKLGQGGFGSVFKGQLSNGQHIAVKRLSKSSRQGTGEFKNEVMLIAKLQHKNLVKLLGCCIQEDETMLIYEYMPNKSLDSIIFDHTRASFLNWKKRFEIILGIARGILYLHQDSRLKIIHRDLKASNILLDAKMNPKISDFGLARIFKEDQTQDKTTRVVGTYGYMSPEYVVYGQFSTKSDVFSFGVILLEIVSGKKNCDSYQEHPSQNLIGHVWELWREDRALDIVDSSIKESYVSDEVLRCIQVGLLCVQEEVVDRPTMFAVNLMLSSETTLPSPENPAFIFKRPSKKLDLVTGGASCSINEVTITKFEAR
ncbi:G-type lectin S-receptor-like serine/threonine-protein kinase RKS1 isoform X1 [Castanea sativa]|uniref:G-type lectin S-receptor-like serine/threonine-protein kinase RKS1 isoform X1 n=1 Tax=Castanea sativa TaxID=21020 RepID=UPI003F64DFAA